MSFDGSDPFSDAMWLIAPRHSPEIQALLKRDTLIKYWNRSLKTKKRVESQFYVRKSLGLMCPNKLNQTRVGISISNEQPSPLILGICCWYEVNVLEKWITLLIAHNIPHTPPPPPQDYTAYNSYPSQRNSIVRSISILTQLSGSQF